MITDIPASAVSTSSWLPVPVPETPYSPWTGPAARKYESRLSRLGRGEPVGRSTPG